MAQRSQAHRHQIVVVLSSLSPSHCRCPIVVIVLVDVIDDIDVIAAAIPVHATFLVVAIVADDRPSIAIVSPSHILLLLRCCCTVDRRHSRDVHRRPRRCIAVAVAPSIACRHHAVRRLAGNVVFSDVVRSWF